PVYAPKHAAPARAVPRLLASAPPAFAPTAVRCGCLTPSVLPYCLAPQPVPPLPASAAGAYRPGLEPVARAAVGFLRGGRRRRRRWRGHVRRPGRRGRG